METPATPSRLPLFMHRHLKCGPLKTPWPCGCKGRTEPTLITPNHQIGVSRGERPIQTGSFKKMHRNFSQIYDNEITSVQTPPCGTSEFLWTVKQVVKERCRCPIGMLQL